MTELALVIATAALVVATVVSGVLAVWVSDRLSAKRTGRLAGRVEELEGVADQLEDRERQLKERADALTELVEQSELMMRGDSVPRGKILYLDGRLEDAIAVLSGVVQRDPTNAEALYYRGLAHDQLRQWADAREDLEAAAVEEPGRPEIRLALARVLYALRDFAGAEEHAQQALDRGVGDMAAALTLIGEARRERGSYVAALDAYNECLRRYPMHSPAVQGIGMVYLAEGVDGHRRFDDAIDWFSDWIGKQPKDTSYLWHRADALLRRNGPGDRAKARADLELATTLNPRDTRAWMRLGSFVVQESRDTEARGDPEEALRLANESIEVYKQGRDVSPRHFRPAFRNRLSMVYQKLGRLQDAIYETSLGVEENPDYIQNYQAYATALLAAAQWEEAEAASAQGLSQPVAQRSPGGRVWLLGFVIEARLAAGCRLDEVHNDLRTLAADLGRLPNFDFSMWDWAEAKDAIRSRWANTAPSVERELASDLLGVLEGSLSIQALSMKWLRGRPGQSPSPEGHPRS